LFLSQFETYRVLQTIKATESAAHASATKTAVTAGGEIPLILKGSGTLDNTVTDTETDAADRTYDPFWKKATRLLAWLRQHNLVEYDLAKAKISQFVIISGSLIVLDLSMLKSMRELKPVRDTILQVVQAASGLATLLPDQQQKIAAENPAQAIKELDSQFETFMAMLPNSPHSVQARIVGDNVNVWCGLEEAGIVGRSSDLLLKHGTLVSGEWNILGVLDAYPSVAQHESLTKAIVELVATPIGQVAAGLAPVVRSLLGRPDAVFGMTPLLIYREVSSG
jgi:hypothetical protein